MRKVKYYKCPECQKKFKTLGGWASHMNMMHPSARPEGFSDTRFFYYTLTGKTEGKCIECKSPTTWNEATGKYNRFCNNPNCKKSYVKLAKDRMINKYGKAYLLDDPEMQRKMLMSKKISGYYTFSDGSGKLGYVGTYEKDFLTMMDKFMGYSASDIMAPSPHTYFYEYDGSKHFYIPDFYVPNLNLEIEIKAQDNTHPKIQAIDKVKEKLKDDTLNANPNINYLKINDKDYKSFFNYLLNLKEAIDETTLTTTGSSAQEINQALEAYEYEPEPEEVGYDYDPMSLVANEGTLAEINPPEDCHNMTEAVWYFIFHTTTSGSRNVGYVSGYDKFSNVLIGLSKATSRQLFALEPEYEGDFADRTYGVYVKYIDNLCLIRNPYDRENEYMMFAMVIPNKKYEIMFDEVFKKLDNHNNMHTPILINWDKISSEWVNHQNKYHYFCYDLMRSLIDTSEVFIDDDNSLINMVNITLIDRGLMCELTETRISDVINSYSRQWDTECFRWIYGTHKSEYSPTLNFQYRCRESVLESTGYYERLSPELEKLYYQNSFTDIEPAEENIQLHTNFDKIKIKGTLDISKYRKITLTQEVLDKYKEKCASFGHCRISDASNGYVWVDKSDNIVGFVNVVRKTDGIKWIQALNLQQQYQGYGLYEQLLKVAVRELGGTDIETPPKNDTAKEVYKKFGFRVYTDEQSRRCMSIRADAARSKYGERAKTNAKTMQEAGLFPVYVILTNATTIEGNYAKLLTNSSYAHISIAFNSNMQEVYSFGTKDGHILLPITLDAKNLMFKLKTDPEANYAMYVKLVSKNDYTTISSKIKSYFSQRSGFKYDVPQVVKDKMASDKVNEKKYFCANFVAFLMGSNKNATEVPDINNMYLLDMGLVKEYNVNFIEKKTKDIYEKHYMHKEKDSNKQPLDEKPQEDEKEKEEEK